MTNNSSFGTGIVASTHNKDVLRIQLRINHSSGVIESIKCNSFGSSGLKKDIESLQLRLSGVSIYSLDDMDLSDISKDIHTTNLIISAVNAAVECYIGEMKYGE